jgi:hypothetical protein
MGGKFNDFPPFLLADASPYERRMGTGAAPS